MARIYCVMCGRVRSPRNRETVEFWSQDPNIAALFYPRKERKRNAICQKCACALRKPYLVHNPNSNTFLRLLHTTSRNIYVKGRAINGLIAIDPIPVGIAWPYPGVLIDAVTLERIEEEEGIKITRAYAKGGPIGRGVPSVIFGHLTPAGPLYCAHFANCCKDTGLTSNTKWSTMRVDDEFLERFPQLNAKVGEHYPALRTTKQVMPGDEILVNSYGSGYWSNQKKEQNERVYRLPFLYPSLKRKLEEADGTRSHKTQTSLKRKRDDLDVNHSRRQRIANDTSLKDKHDDVDGSRVRKKQRIDTR